MVGVAEGLVAQLDPSATGAKRSSETFTVSVGREGSGLGSRGGCRSDLTWLIDDLPFDGLVTSQFTDRSRTGLIGVSEPRPTRFLATLGYMESPMGSFLCPPGFAGPRGLRALAREGSALTEAARLAGSSASSRLRRREVPHALRGAQRDLAPVVLVPGFLAGDGSLGLLARHLRRVGYRTYRSAIHANVRCTREAAEALEARIEMIATRRGQPVSLVGHSLGGLLARGVAARRPDLVDGIITLGSPLLAPGAAHPVLLLDLAVMVRLRRLGFRTLMGEDCTSGECAELSWEQGRAPLSDDVRFTTVYSRRDGIIDWRACLDPQARPVEVTTSHLGMALDPDVLEVVAQALGDHRGGRSVRPPAIRPAAPRATAG